MTELKSNLSKIIENIQQHLIRAHNPSIKQDIKQLLICSAQFHRNSIRLKHPRATHLWVDLCDSVLSRRAKHFGEQAKRKL